MPRSLAALVGLRRAAHIHEKRRFGGVRVAAFLKPGTVVLGEEGEVIVLGVRLTDGRDQQVQIRAEVLKLTVDIKESVDLLATREDAEEVLGDRLGDLVGGDDGLRVLGQFAQDVLLREPGRQGVRTVVGAFGVALDTRAQTRGVEHLCELRIGRGDVERALQKADCLAVLAAICLRLRDMHRDQYRQAPEDQPEPVPAGQRAHPARRPAPSTRRSRAN